MQTDFKNLEELKKRITPALTSKIKELKTNYLKITEEDIWTYLKKKWQHEKNLTLYDIINDIFKLDYETISDYKIKRSMPND